MLMTRNRSAAPTARLESRPSDHPPAQLAPWRIDFVPGNRQLKFPGEAQANEGADDPVADVDLPPAQAVPGRGREGVVVVVPPLPQAENAEQEVVPAAIAGLEGTAPPQMAHRVDAPGNVMDQEDPGQAAPQQAAQGARPGPREQGAQRGRDQ